MQGGLCIVLLYAERQMLFHGFLSLMTDRNGIFSVWRFFRYVTIMSLIVLLCTIMRLAETFSSIFRHYIYIINICPIKSYCVIVREEA